MEKKKTLKIETIILGGSFAGLSCLEHLNRYYRDSAKHKVALVSVEQSLASHPLLVEYACNGIPGRAFQQQIPAGLIHAEVLQLDLQHKRVHLRNFKDDTENQIEFERLVLAMDSLPSSLNAPGLRDFAYELNTIEDAQRLHETLESRYASATTEPDIETRLRQLTFVISGGSDEAIHLAGNLLHRLKQLVASNPEISKEDVHVFLIHTEPKLLPSRSSTLSLFVQEALRKEGLKLSLERQIKAVEAGRVLLDDGSYIETDTCIITGGNRPHPILEEIESAFPITRVQGRIQTEESLRVPGYSWLWACGDSAAVPREEGGFYPNSPLCGARQGVRLAQNLIDTDQNRALHPFTCVGPGEFVPLGQGRAAVEIFNLQLSSRLFGWLWKQIRARRLTVV